MEVMLEMKIQIVVLGTGDIKYEEMLKYYQAKYHDKMAVRITYDDKLAHKIYCGADMILVPSLFEPCGLTQMIAMRYGTLPVVRETGGLKDSVIPYNKFTGEGNGFSFANYNAHELLDTIKRAARIFYDDKALWKHLVNNALQSDFSWKKSAQRYVEIYEKTL
jgi:starch synthase